MAKIIRYAVYLIIMIGAFFQFNCIPAPVFRLETGEKENDWYYGRQVITKEDSLNRVQLTFEDIQENNYVFYLEIKNKSEFKEVVDPAEIYLESYYPVDSEKTITLSRINACDPEKQIISIDKSINQTNSAENTRRGLSCLVSAVDFTSTVTKIGKKRSKEEIEEENRERENRRIDNENAEAEYKEKNDRLNDNRSYWQNDTFRKTTLENGQNAGGYIHIPFWGSAKYLRIVIPVEKSKYIFRYKQTAQ
ncbi:MAG: hypothetical protein ACM34K_16065 [Bacillota bacterium]